MARVGFSYLGDAVTLMSVAPTKNIPSRRLLNRLLDEVQTRLSGCRLQWWTTTGTACLVNQWLTMPAPGKAEPCGGPAPGAKQIAEASYETSSGRLRLIFRDGTSVQVKP
jgi:hypothetical protein